MPRVSDRRTFAALALLSCFSWSAPSAAQIKEACVDAANTAQTLKDAGKYNAARARLVVCSNNACPSLVSQSCQKWLTQIDAELPTVIFSVKDDSGRDRADVKVAIDGEMLLERLSGTPVPVDPGEHVVRFESPGLEKREQHIVLHSGEKNRLVTVALTAVSVTPPPVAPVEGPNPAPSSSSAMRNIVGISLGGLAVGSAVAGFYFAGKSHDQAEEARSLRQTIASPSGCTGVSSLACNHLSDAVAGQHRDTNISTAFLVTAVGLAVGAAVVWLVWPSNHRARQDAAWITW